MADGQYPLPKFAKRATTLLTGPPPQHQRIAQHISTHSTTATSTKNKEKSSGALAVGPKAGAGGQPASSDNDVSISTLYNLIQANHLETSEAIKTTSERIEKNVDRKIQNLRDEM